MGGFVRFIGMVLRMGWGVDEIIYANIRKRFLLLLLKIDVQFTSQTKLGSRNPPFLITQRKKSNTLSIKLNFSAL